VFTEDELLPISALQHLAFCPRQWALIHLEGLWSDNRLTVEGTIAHERVHSNEAEARGDIRIARGLRVRSLRLGIIGQLDVVEFHKTQDKQKGVTLDGTNSLWQPVIIEHKHGKPKIDNEDEIQLCAQALCLEEMLGIVIEAGSFFYGKPRRRSEVAFGQELRKQTENSITLLHELTRSGKTPPPENSPKCRNCSMISQCLPTLDKRKNRIKEYMTRSVDLSKKNHETTA